MLFTHIATVATLMHAGRLRALAVTGDHRHGGIPRDWKQSPRRAIPGFDVTTWHGIVAPANTPQPIVMRLHGELVRIVGTAGADDSWRPWAWNR